jgi:hypothetical protein
MKFPISLHENDWITADLSSSVSFVSFLVHSLYAFTINCHLKDTSHHLVTV